MIDQEKRIAGLEDALVHLCEYNTNETCLECGLIKALQVEIGTSDAYRARARARGRVAGAGRTGHVCDP